VLTFHLLDEILKRPNATFSNVFLGLGEQPCHVDRLDHPLELRCFQHHHGRLARFGNHDWPTRTMDLVQERPRRRFEVLNGLDILRVAHRHWNPRNHGYLTTTQCGFNDNLKRRIGQR